MSPPAGTATASRPAVVAALTVLAALTVPHLLTVAWLDTRTAPQRRAPAGGQVRP